MKIGHARISRKGKSLDLQIDALEKEGCEKVFRNTVSSTKAHRKGLEDMLSQLPDGDAIFTWK